MDLVLLRYGQDKASTGGILYVNGDFFCYTCEDGFNEIKIAGASRISPGRYDIKLRAEGGMHSRYTKRFWFHDGMLHLQDVPNFEWIYIHCGNSHRDTSGCILVGFTANHGSDFNVGKSELAYADLYLMIKSALNTGETINIEVRDNGYMVSDNRG